MLFKFKNRQEKIQPLDLSKPDAIVSVTNTRISKNAFGPEYRGCCLIMDDYITSSCFRTISGGDMPYGETTKCGVNFLSPEVYPATLWVGRVLMLYEGERLVGTMTVEEIKNAVLDRDKKLMDSDGVLENEDYMNTALKLSLEWGKGYMKPLDNKLMKALPDLSGKDIDKLCGFAEKIKDDVLWHIYYGNFDYKEQKMRIDAVAVVREKYPWINEINLVQLNTQGLYYAWHG